MRLLPDDERFLQRALDLATSAASFASPNPTVGCVLARNSEVLGEGAHFYDNYDHAEVAALKQAQAAGLSIRGAVAYVTLEPCAHHGRTGPCAIALVQAGIARCVVATVDPNPQVSGKGIAILRDAGVTVVVADPTSAMTSAARRLNNAFAFSIQRGRPFVTLKSALSLDGYIAPPPASRRKSEPVWLTGEPARADVQLLRHRSDALITGIGTILADNPALTDRTGLPRRRNLLRIIFDRRLRTPLDATIIDTAHNDLIVMGGGDFQLRSREALERLGVQVVRPTGNGVGFDLQSVLQFLQNEGIRSVMLEGGSKLNSSFLQAGLVDEVVLYYSDVELGEGSVRFASHLAISPYTLQQALTGVTRASFSHSSGSSREDVRISGYLHDPWAGVA